jgi:glycosyltransferase involved in cell wall biosynthesis
VVGYSGNLGRAHEFGTVLDAADRLREEADIVFLFVGGGHHRRWVETEARRRGLGNLLFRPYQPRERLRESLGLADVHLISLLPALEGLIVPSKFYGIAAAGRPVLYVGDPEGEIPQLLRAAVCGETVHVGEGDRLAAAVRHLRDDPALCLLWGANARRRFAAHFDQRLALAAWERVLKRVTSRNVSR